MAASRWMSLDFTSKYFNIVNVIYMKIHSYIGDKTKRETDVYMDSGPHLSDHDVENLLWYS